MMVLGVASCDWAKRKTKETVNKSGEIVAKTGSEFVDGMAKGIEKTFQNEIVISEELSERGLSTGKIIIANSDSATDNVLSVYFIFDSDFDQKITAKVFDEDGVEYGRTTLAISGLADEAKYFDFVFDKRTNIDGKGKLTFE